VHVADCKLSILTVNVRPDAAQTAVYTWAWAKMPLAATPLPGSRREQALWQAQRHELNAQQNNLLCDIQATGLGRDRVDSTPARDVELTRRF
jgi:hypothetical protein